MNKTELKKLYNPINGIIIVKNNILYTDYMILDLSLSTDNEKIIKYIKRNQKKSNRIGFLNDMYEYMLESKDFEFEQRCYLHNAKKSPFDFGYYELIDKDGYFYISEDILDFIVKLFHRGQSRGQSSSPNIYCVNDSEKNIIYLYRDGIKLGIVAPFKN